MVPSTAIHYGLRRTGTKHTESFFPSLKIDPESRRTSLHEKYLLLENRVALSGLGLSLGKCQVSTLLDCHRERVQPMLCPPPPTLLLHEAILRPHPPEATRQFPLEAPLSQPCEPPGGQAQPMAWEAPEQPRLSSMVCRKPHKTVRWHCPSTFHPRKKPSSPTHLPSAPEAARWS